MKSAQIGASAMPPVRPRSRLSSKPTQMTQTRLLVKPANQPSREVPVFPAAGSVKPRARTPAAVPWFMTSFIRLVTRKVTRGSRTFLVCGVAFSSDFAVRADDFVDELGFGARAAVGERGVRCGDIDRRHFVSAEGDGGSRLDVLAEAHLARDLHDAAVADQLGDFDGGDVERVGERLARGDAAHEFCAVIVGRVFLAVEFESGGLVVDRGGGRDDGLHVVDGVVERGGVDERLEDRSGLAMRERVIELALAVVAAADDRFDFAGARVERDEGGLHVGNRFVASLLRGFLFPLVVFFGEQLVYVLRAFFDGVDGDALRAQGQAWCRRGNFR